MTDRTRGARDASEDATAFRLHEQRFIISSAHGAHESRRTPPICAPPCRFRRTHQCRPLRDGRDPDLFISIRSAAPGQPLQSRRTGGA